MFVFDNSEDLDIATYEYRIYTEDQVEVDPTNPGYYRLIGNVSINSGTVTPYRQGFNLANVFTVAVDNSTTTSTEEVTSPVYYYGAVRAIDTSANASPWTLVKETDISTPLIDEEFIGSLTAAKITAGTIGAAEIVLNGANSIIRSFNYSAGSLGWKITGLGDAEFNNLVIRTALDIGGSDASSFHVDVDGNLWLGASTYGTAPFRISNTGNVDVGGADASSFHIDNTGNIWAGAGTFNTSTNPFSVTAAGALRATGANISGAITATSGTFNGRLQAGDIYIPNTTSPVFSVTTAGAVTASSVTITGGTVGGINTSNDKLFIGTGNYNNANTAFYVDNTGNFSLKDKLSWNGTTLTIQGAITATSGTFNGRLQAGDIYIPNTSSPVFSVTTGGAVTATSGTIGGFTLASTTLSATSGSVSFGNYASIVINSNGLIDSYFQNIGFVSSFSENVKINNYAAGGNGAINVTGTASGSFSERWYTSYGVYNPSDIRLKNIIEEEVNALSLIENIQTTKFVFKKDETERQHFGFIAQQMNEHIPYVAIPGGEDPDRQPWGIVQENLIPYLVKSIQQLSQKVDALESRLV
jgi:hypothetical protein